MFITTGDGDITQPYEPLGQMTYVKSGFRIPLPLLGFIPISDALAEDAINGVIAEKARALGGNAVINLQIDWNPPQNGFLGLGATGGTLTINGTVVKQSTTPRTLTTRTTTSPTGANVPSASASSPTPQTPRSQIGASTDLMQMLLQGEPAHHPFLAYGGGLRLGYVMRRHGAKFALTPSASFGGRSKEESVFVGTFYNSSTRSYESIYETLKTSYRLIPLDFNVTANFSAFTRLSASLPPKLNPYAEVGLTYLIWNTKAKYSSRFGSGESDTHWDFFEAGLNFGAGVEYSVQPNLAVSAGLKRYVFFKSHPKLGFWNWQVGVSFYPRP